ncbi:unnamed protein product [Blumeria hordei]|uniref:Domain of unknown function at the cortex 1 domain-containing protein n=1 Tax=Blumeria hordei TaxID=2867405 RepID=A0A383V0T9_BLUHO|nr:unnamed protein product [Blumeria hordei]
MASKYLLQVTAGSSYDATKHQIVPVNSPEIITVESEHVSVSLNVRVQSYRGLPINSPSTSPYFLLPPHSKNNDQYSISFAFTPKSTISANDLLFGNDFDYPIRDRLPPGFNAAFRIVKWLIDPGLEGDVYADQPYLYGPAASSLNVIHFGSKDHKFIGKKIANTMAGLVFTEGGCADGSTIRKAKGIPDSETARKKFFLNDKNRAKWDWEAGREYGCEFFNPYLDFNEFALRLPGFTLPMIKYFDVQSSRNLKDKSDSSKFPIPRRSHRLRYTLKNRANNSVLFVIVFTLYLKEDVDENGTVRECVEHINHGKNNSSSNHITEGYKDKLEITVEDEVD